MEKKEICFIAQFPPPIHGLSKAVDTLYNSKLSTEFRFQKVDITNNKRIIKNLYKIWCSNADLYYFTISQTKGGNIRDLLILKILNLKNKKCLVHLHGGYYRKLVDENLPRWLKRVNYKAISKLEGAIVLSDSLKRIFQGMIKDDKIFVVPNCVDDQYFLTNKESEIKLKAEKKKDIYHVLYLSNFIKSKGYLEVLKLAKLEKERCKCGEKKKFHFNFAGRFFEEGDKRLFFEYIEQFGLQDYITFHGVVDGEQKKQILKESDIFILLTRYPNEGQPISILEAMGNGMIIVTTNHAGIPDIVQNDVNGYVSSNLDVVEIRDWLVRNNENFFKIANQNRYEAMQKYTESMYLSNMKDIFLKHTK